MKRRKHTVTVIFASVVMALLILDTATAVSGAAEGIALCIQVIIPSLFPFFIVTTYLNAALLGLRIPGFGVLTRLLKIPSGGDSLLLMGLIGGYPVGAQLIADNYANKRLNRWSSQILLGYCSNAGPAFIFGVTSTLFSSRWIPFTLWGIHIFSALITGLLLPRPDQAEMKRPETGSVTLVVAMKKSITICASVCGWVIVFKIITAYIKCWLGTLLSGTAFVILSGLLELSNGCILLSGVSNEALRFILCAIFLSFGGICVLLQTASVTEPLGLGLYIPGKIIQTAVSFLSASLAAYMLFPDSPQNASIAIPALISIPVILLLRRYSEKICGNSSENTV